MNDKQRTPNMGAGREALDASSPLPKPAPSAQRRAPKRQRRKGILLLVALSMLVLFLLVGTAFVVTSRHAYRTQKAEAKASQNTSAEVGQADLLDDILKQVVRDTKNPNSVLRNHSLLRDMYGEDGFVGSVPVPNAQTDADGLTARWAPTRDVDGVSQNFNITNGQILEIDVLGVEDLFGNQAAANVVNGMKLQRNAYNGMTLTFTSGFAKGVSTRIVGYIPANHLIDPVSGSLATPTPTYPRKFARFRLLAFPLADGSTLNQDYDRDGDIDQLDFQQLLEGSEFVVNGRPFNGTGVGYDSTATTGDARLSAKEMVTLLDGSTTLDMQVALEPNTIFFDPGSVVSTTGTTFNYFPPNPLGTITVNSPYSGFGGSDESYDAVDFQNMLLALMPKDLQGNAWVVNDVTDPSSWPSDPTSLSTSGNNVPLPSLHRPALLNYWKTEVANSGSHLAVEPMVLRKVMLRPSWLDHPNFTGSNPEFAQAFNQFDTNRADPDNQRLIVNRMIAGPWDVDNDNDGYRDSVWVDFGASIISMPDGTLVKPMAAVLCLDLDGRLNVNAHGSREQVKSKVFTTRPPGAYPPFYDAELAGTAVALDLPFGQGLGPADIDLEPLLGAEWANRTIGGSRGIDATGLAPLSGRQLTGRYGNIYTDGFGYPGSPSQMDIQYQLNMQGVPVGFGSAAPPSLYGSAPDFASSYPSTGINDFGQPVSVIAEDTSYQSRDMPYEMNLLNVSGESPNSPDSPYTVNELERLLRVYDADATTASERLATLTNFVGSNLQARNLITTDSFDLPVPAGVLPSWVNETDGTKMDLDGNTGNDDSFLEVMGRPAVGASFADLMEYRMRAVTAGLRYNRTATPNFLPPLSALQRRALERLIPQDLADGKLLDINRALGNGRDDNNNGVVDEPGEPEGAQWRLQQNVAALGQPIDVQPVDPADNIHHPADAFVRDDLATTVDMIDRNQDGMIEFDSKDPTKSPIELRDPRVRSVAYQVAWDNLRRQELAKDLYITALAAADPFDVDSDDGKRRCRELAQWAINSVDFRDADSAMTAFEYDHNPFDGWDVDGEIGTLGGVNNTLDSLGPDGKAGTADDIGGIVWGLERPELVMTETLAWHDRRTSNYSNEIIYSDRNNPNPNQPPRNPSLLDRSDPEKDQDFDQRFVPRGGLLIELYNPNAPNPAAPADTHRIVGGQDLGVNLSTFTNYTDLSGSAQRSPVWRMAFYKRTQKYASDQAMQWNPDSLVDWKVANGGTAAVVGRPPADAKLDRCAYFTDFAPAYDVMVEGEPFYSGTTSPYHVRPGRYMVVGGDNQVVIADQDGSRSDPAKKSRRFELNTTTGSVRLMHEKDGVIEDPLTGEEMRTPLDSGFADASATAAATPGADVAIINMPNPLTASEPAEGYPERIMGARLDKTTGEYKDSNGTLMTLDVPMDGPIGTTRPANEVHPAYPEFEAAKQRVDAIYASKPDPRVTYSVIFLQRLANPLLGWNPEAGHPEHREDDPVNPYRTVDSMGVNLSVFNSIGDVAIGQVGNEEDGTSPREARRTFTSLQRGMTGQEKLGSAATAPMASLMAFEPFSSEKRATLGPRNGADGLGFNPPAPADFKNMLTGQDYNGDFTFDAIPSATMGYLNRPFQDTALSGEALHAKPQTPFDWLTWNNRPYVSGNELMLVPRTSSFELFRAFATADPKDNDPVTGLEQEWPYQAIQNGAATPAHNGFEHLLGFHNTLDPAATMPPAPEEPMTGLYRMLDYVHTPSLFVGTKNWLNPVAFNNNTVPVTSTDDPRYGKLIPNNFVSEFRDPGEVNLNTIADGTVWKGIQQDMGGAQKHLGPEAQEFASSRRGYGSDSDAMLSLSSDSPTFFANPFRATGAGDLVPLAAMERPDVETGLLRSDSLDATMAPSDTPVMFERKEARNGATKDPRNTDRNAYFHYQPVTRLDNLTTTRSNVFAVWITVGFFEVAPAPAPTSGEFQSLNDPSNNLTSAQLQALYDRIYPEGYQLGREFGLDTGDTRRLRKFSIVDRSIPVGFEPGVDHNVEETIRLDRQIE
ncbi:hypothetical protein [Adhaeretor mobilis]|uniref:Uncharacterized protein n=1 Tax=Adhaeretor mobilis TaxID=1930276 RepID=A0A517MT25_9BACT|nr:hypothetical protein [Adhaeretor mobilis]QDS98028.1 hypothetical protein HG15A2_12980 [Adhaeretor mobilis]